MDREQLHDELDQLVIGNRSGLKMVVHALIDLGYVTAIECAYEACDLPTRKFAFRAKNLRGKADAITIDHVVQISDGGTDRPENLRLLHWRCNTSRGTKLAYQNPEVRQRASDAIAARWQTEEYRQKMIGREHGVEEREKRRVAMTNHWLDPEKRAIHRAALPRGADWHAKRKTDFTPIPCDVCGQPCKGKAALSLHKTRKHST